MLVVHSFSQCSSIKRRWFCIVEERSRLACFTDGSVKAGDTPMGFGELAMNIFEGVRLRHGQKCFIILFRQWPFFERFKRFSNPERKVHLFMGRYRRKL